MNFYNSDNRIIIGLQNEDSYTCYLNSVLQILFNIDPLNNFISKTKNISNKNEGTILTSYKDILHLLISEDGNTLDDENIITSNVFKSQQISFKIV